MTILKKKNYRKKTQKAPKDTKNWYADRYQTIVVQRNYLLLLTLIAIIGIAASVIAVITISNSRTIEPFVIEIEEKTGITNVIRPLVKERFAYDETLRRYFINKYITARETYDYYSFEHNYFTVVRLLSTAEVYGEFRREVYADNPSSPIRLGKQRRNIKIKSIAFLKTRSGEAGYTAQIRFNVKDIKRERNLVATMTFDYRDLSLTTNERAVNPLGFQVLSYRVDNEVL